MQQEVIAGNQQGFVLVRDDSTNESNSLEIANISFPSTITAIPNSGAGGPTVITSNNTFVVGQTITISGVTGMTQINGGPYTIIAVSPTTITIAVDSSAFGVYINGGTVTPTRTVWCPNHCLNNGDFIIISGALGEISYQVNNRIFKVDNATTNEFNLNPTITASTYFGGGLIKRMYIPFIQTKQFPVAWDMGRKSRLGDQKYLLTTTQNSQIQLLIYLSQNSNSPYNTGGVVPDVSVINNSLIYSSLLYTCPESCNLGLTAANTNLQMITEINPTQTDASSPQAQIWHRVNTSLIGDSVQIGFNLSEDQMRSLDSVGTSIIITGATQANPCVLTANNNFAANDLIFISGVNGMTQLNGNIYTIISRNSTTLTIGVNAIGFDAFALPASGTAIRKSPINQFAEIELHGIILMFHQVRY